MKRIVLIIGLLCVLVGAGAVYKSCMTEDSQKADMVDAEAKQKAEMEAAVDSIYQYILPMYYSDATGNDIDYDDWLERFCTPSLRHQVQMIDDWEEKNREVGLGYDYWIGAQDYEHPVVKVVGSKARTDSTGVVRISITEENMMPKVRYMRLEMKREKGVWLINDFKNEDDGKIYSLRKISREFLREQYGEALERDRKEHPVKRQVEFIDGKGKKVKPLK